MKDINEYGYSAAEWAALGTKKRWAVKNRERVRALARARYSRTPPEKLALKVKKARQRRRTDAAKAREAAQKKEYWKNLPPEEKKLRIARANKRRIERRAAMSPHELAEIMRMEADKAIERRAQASAQRQAEAASIAEAREAMRPQWRNDNRAAFNKDPAGMMRLIDRAVPRWHSSDIRDDIASDIAIALMDGDLPIAEIGRSIQSFVTAHYAGRDWHKWASFDTPIAGDGKGTLGDLIDADRFHF